METAGEFLKRNREEQALTIRKVADDTNITSRHIEALENGNYSIFPGETYTMGFLRSYASYLGLDADYVLQLYRNAQLEEIEVPLQELTRPATTYADYVMRYFRMGVIPLVLLFVVLIVYLFINRTPTPRRVQNNVSNIETFLKKSDNIPDTETEHISLRSGFTTALIGVGKGINFSVQNAEVYLVLESIDYNQAGGQSSAQLELFPGRSKLNLREGEPVWIEQPGIPRKFRISLTGATPNNAKLQIEIDQTEGELAPAAGEENLPDTESRIANPSNFIIVFEAVTTADNFVEFYVDGHPQKKGLLSTGSKIYYEANDSIQMKIGDAGGIRIRINGKDYVFGKRGEQVKKTIRKAKDPVEQTKYSVVIKDS